MLKKSIVLMAGLMAHPFASAQLLQRDLGDFDLKLGTSPSRSMAQGLIKPSAASSLHGGLDLTHESGWYVGQWSPSMGLTSTSNLEIDSYAGFKHSFDSTLGYEVGMIHYSYPGVETADTHELYTGLRLFGTRFGAAFSNTPESRNSTLFANLGGLPLLDIDVSFKVSNHQLGTPFSIDGSNDVSAFNDWSLQLSRSFMGLDLNLTYTDSDLSGPSCGAYSGHNSQCEAVLTVQAVRSLF